MNIELKCHTFDMALNVFKFKTKPSLDFLLLPNPLSYGGWGERQFAPYLGFCPLLQISLGNPDLKILEFSNILLRMSFPPVAERVK